MAIQVNHIKGDIVELIFNPKEDNLSIGENLSLREKGTEQGIIVQVVEFRTVSYPSLLMEQLRLTLSGEPFFPLPLLQFAEKEFHEMRNLKIAIAKIRKLTGSSWDGWNGWISARDVVVERTNDLDEAVLRQADNLFLLNLPFEDDVRHVSKSAIIDMETMGAFVRRLRSYHALAIGNVTRNYPLIVMEIPPPPLRKGGKVDPLEGINTAGETKFFFKPKRET